jgi:hypothetical protein
MRENAACIFTVKVGDAILDPNDTSRTVKVKAACEDKHHGHWFCLTHAEGFANQLEKDSHIHSGIHKLVWICHTHGAEQP